MGVTDFFLIFLLCFVVSLVSCVATAFLIVSWTHGSFTFGWDYIWHDPIAKYRERSEYDRSRAPFHPIRFFKPCPHWVRPVSFKSRWRLFVGEGGCGSGCYTRYVNDEDYEYLADYAKADVEATAAFYTKE